MNDSQFAIFYPVLKMIKDIQEINNMKQCPEDAIFTCADYIELINPDTNTTIKVKINEKEKEAILVSFFFTPRKITGNYFDKKKEYVEDYSSIEPLLRVFKHLNYHIIREVETSSYLEYLKGIHFKLKGNKLMPIDYEKLTEENKPDFIMPLNMVETIIRLNKFYKEEHHSLKIEGDNFIFETNSFIITQKSIHKEL